MIETCACLHRRQKPSTVKVLRVTAPPRLRRSSSAFTAFYARLELQQAARKKKKKGKMAVQTERKDTDRMGAHRVKLRFALSFFLVYFFTGLSPIKLHGTCGPSSSLPYWRVRESALRRVIDQHSTICRFSLSLSLCAKSRAEKLRTVRAHTAWIDWPSLL